MWGGYFATRGFICDLTKLFGRKIIKQIPQLKYCDVTKPYIAHDTLLLLYNLPLQLLVDIF